MCHNVTVKPATTQDARHCASEKLEVELMKVIHLDHAILGSIKTYTRWSNYKWLITSYRAKSKFVKQSMEALYNLVTALLPDSSLPNPITPVLFHVELI